MGLDLKDLQIDLEDFQQAQNNSLKCYKQVIPVNIFHFYLMNEIKEPHYYLELLNALKTREQHDYIYIYINSEGGSFYTAIQIVNAIKHSKANVVTCLEGAAFSGASMIFLAAKQHLVSENSSFMIHNYSGMAGGKGHEISSQVKYSDKFFTKVYKNIYQKILSEDEIDSVIAGKDIWMDSDEVIKRLGDSIISIDDSES